MDTFRFEYRPGTIRYGSVGDIGDELARIGVDNVLVVCGTTVGTTSAVIDPVRTGLADRLAEVFAETSPEKRIETAFRAADELAHLDGDAIVGLGGGSSLDLARVTAAVAGSDRHRTDVVAELADQGTITIPDSVPPMIAIPTTLAGAECSQAAGVSAAPETVEQATGRARIVKGGISDPQLMPRVVWYDPDLFRTTPHDVLTASAMNGFDKAVESPYARTRTPVTDATATHALGLLSEALPRLGAGERDDRTMHDVVVGTLLAQYGVSRSDGSSLSVIHAFGHGLRDAGLQQGTGHGIVAPHALRYLFGEVDGRRHLLADGFGVDHAGMDNEAIGDAVVDAVVAVRDGLGLPDRLRTVDGPDREDLPAVARTIAEDRLLINGPPDFSPDAEAIVRVLEAAW